MGENILSQMADRGIQRLREDDPDLFNLLIEEHQRQRDVLTMVASSSVVDPSVLMSAATVAMNVTAEGYPGARFHAGCRVIDKIEQLAIDRAKTAFGAQYVNVQVHSASAANQIVMCKLLEPGDTLLGLNLDSGGHLTHGSKVSISGQYFNAVPYGITEEGDTDYDEVLRLAKQHKPKLIVCGTTAYPRKIDFARFRSIADEVGAWLLADIAHITALVIAGEHPSPIDHAHITTTCTHKQLYGPRGALIMSGRDAETTVGDGKRTLSQLMQQAVFPFLQGAPNLAVIAAKARALEIAVQPEFKLMARRIVENARALSDYFLDKNYRVITGGTDNHMVVIDVRSHGLTGIVAERALESCDIIVNKNRVPHDTKGPTVTSGIRLGTNSLARRGLEPAELQLCAELIDRVLTSVVATGDREFELPDDVRHSVRMCVKDLCTRFPVDSYALESHDTASPIRN